MTLTTAQLSDILQKSKFIALKDIDEGVKTAVEFDKPLIDVLLFRGLISEEALGQIIAAYYKVPFVYLRNRILPVELINLIPENVARSFRIIPYEKKEGILNLAMENPKDIEAIEYVKRRTGLKVKPYFIIATDLTRALFGYKREVKKEFAAIIAENLKKAAPVSEEDIARAAANLPVIRILDTILDYAAAEGASDIHIEHLEGETMIRFRVDGILRDVVSLPKEIHPAIIARIKILSDLRIDEHRVPQDGRFKFKLGDEFVAVRVSVMPTFFGENVVMRLLAESARPLSFDELGFTGKNLDLLKIHIKKSHGMILVTGPTGSGKTTTLYSVLNVLNVLNVKICTIEDPVEYNIKRINQTQINPAAKLLFSTGLRSLLRHDPDIIMVGEIRDAETADMAIQSALTGHLVLSTLHTNDAPSTIPRLLDMGAEGFLVASTVNLVIAQRLVRRICPSCIKEYVPDDVVLRFVKKEFTARTVKWKFYQGKGCLECGKTGYKGRIGIYEVLEMSDEIRDLILERKAASEIKKTAVREGMLTMLADGANKVASGLTTIEEVLRAVRE